MGFKVEAMKKGCWYDSGARVYHDVEPGSVVEFREASDAAFFVNGGAGQWHNEPRDTPQPKSESKPKKAATRRSKKADDSDEGDDDVQEAASE